MVWRHTLFRTVTYSSDRLNKNSVVSCHHKMHLFTLIFGIVLLPKGKFLFCYRVLFFCFSTVMDCNFQLPHLPLQMKKMNWFWLIYFTVKMLKIILSNPCRQEKLIFLKLTWVLCFISLHPEVLWVYAGNLRNLHRHNKRMFFGSVWITKNDFICRYGILWCIVFFIVKQLWPSLQRFLFCYR